QLDYVRGCGARADRLHRRGGMGHATQRRADEEAEQTAIQREGPDGSHGQSPSDEAPALTMTRCRCPEMGSIERAGQPSSCPTSSRTIFPRSPDFPERL